MQNWLKTFRISIIFTFFYIGVNGIVLLVNGFKYPVNPLFTFLTSWFNLSEDYSFSSFYVGFSLNFLVPLSIIATYEYYLMSTSLRDKYYFVNVYVSFVFGVIATYILSAYNWVKFHYPGSGSSILAFGFLILFIFYFCVNLSFSYDKKLERRKSIEELGIKKTNLIIKIMSVITAISLYCFSYLLFIFQNKSWGLHVDGLIIFILLVLFFKSGLVIYRTFKDMKTRKLID